MTHWQTLMFDYGLIVPVLTNKRKSCAATVLVENAV